MRFKDVFSIIGPVMVGPSSSHTAGAVRLGLVARQLLGEQPKRVDIQLYGSFAETYVGHGTDVALVAGLLHYNTDDLRIRSSMAISETLGMEVAIQPVIHSGASGIHPNTAAITASSNEHQVKVVGCSIGGGNIEITNIDGFDVKFTASYPTLVVFHQDHAGLLAQLTNLLNESGVNIGFMEVDRKGRNGAALTVIECDSMIDDALQERIVAIPSVQYVRCIDLYKKEGME